MLGEARVRRGDRWRALRPRTRLAVIAVVALALIAGGVALTRSPLFSARTITVRGAAHLTDAEVLQAAGIHPGTNVFYLDTAGARAKLVADPWIASATVIRSLPSTVTITIQEVRPVAITSSADAPMLLAQDGTVLGPAPDGTRLPVIGAAGEGSLEGPAAALGAMPPTLLARIQSVAVAIDGTLSLTLRDGVTVTYGDALDADRKAQALKAVLAWARSQPIGVISIDVSSPAVPTAHLRGTTTATAVAPPSRSPKSPSPSP